MAEGRRPDSWRYCIDAVVLGAVVHRVCVKGPPRGGLHADAAYEPSKRRSTIDALCPPKPDEFETATPTSASRASFGM